MILTISLWVLNLVDMTLKVDGTHDSVAKLG